MTTHMKGNVMAKSAVETPEQSDMSTSQGRNFSPLDGGNAILAAWRGLYHIFGARVNSFVVTEDGVFVNGLTMNDQYDIDTVVGDIGASKNRNRRLELIPNYFYVNGEEPQPFNDSAEITAWLVATFRGSIDDSSTKSPAYARKAVADFKKAQNLYKQRGPKRKVIRLDNLKELDESVLLNIDIDDLLAFQTLISKTVADKEASASS